MEDMEDMKQNKGLVFLKALAAAYVITGLLLLLLAFLVYRLEWDESKANIGIIAIYLLSGFAGGFMAGKCGKTRRFLWGLGIGAAYYIILTIVSLIMGQESGTPFVQMMTTMALCLGSGMLGGMVSQ